MAIHESPEVNIPILSTPKTSSGALGMMFVYKRCLHVPYSNKTTVECEEGGGKDVEDAPQLGCILTKCAVSQSYDARYAIGKYAYGAESNQ